MARFRNTLNHVRIAAPCNADWDEMFGSDRVRFCGLCSLNVYNLTSMSRSEAESLIARTEGRLCVRFYRRPDGSIMTKDCPIGLRAIRRRMKHVAKAISSAVMGLLAGLGVYGSVTSIVPLAPQRTMGVMVRDVDPPGETTADHLVRADPPAPGFTMGRMLAKPIRHRRASSQRRNGASR